ncbi:MAG: TMEM43 family protein [Candidatus Edwardsbacteria bacterium]|nr:TMEM43 family protein [Candidatus Edwardsbacteria bacterium]
MADEFKEVTNPSTGSGGWGGNIKNAFVGALIGILLFFLSFYVLWTNEGRVNMAKVAAKMTAIQSEKVDPACNGQAVSVSGQLSAVEQLGDPEFLKPGPYISLERTVEMFAWVEEKETKEKQNTGGSATKETTYRYEKKWTDDPENSKEFKHPEGHENPARPFQSETFTVKTAAIGAYRVDPAGMYLPETGAVSLDTAKVNIKGRYKLTGEYIFIGNGTLTNPSVGDVRISFSAVPNDIKVTAFGKVEAGGLVPYMYKGKHRLYRAIALSRDEAIALIAHEHKVTGWLLRLIGFLMMWFGLQALFGPVVAVLGVLPFLGKVGRFVWGFITFFVSLFLSLVVIVISMIAHNVWALLAVVAIIVGLFFWLKTKKKEATPVAPAAPAK